MTAKPDPVEWTASAMALKRLSKLTLEERQAWSKRANAKRWAKYRKAKGGAK